MPGNKCPVHGIPDCSLLLNGCNLPARLAEVESLRADLAAALARNAELARDVERLSQLDNLRNRVNALAKKWDNDWESSGSNAAAGALRNCTFELRAAIVRGSDDE